ncbi:rRNA pseudouridine synthase [Clostridium sp. 'deep sea']|uniref:pseudouridine synthase n=1 Tax=Clostridium sp. 'deep sea' TaxID=2779445 RepID=UPI001896642A|nr:pseudouridine synthase [Clostridium sp. 'deep sea']QOR35815.1 rRNA pseudouridine synthase [Clostridium sp. 'deep sea']
MKEIRLQKFMALCGVASRRASEKLIAEGRVKVNGIIVAEMGVKIDPEKDIILVNNKKIRLEQKKVYLLLNKPLGVITSVSDDLHRTTVVDLVNIPERIYPVGRLDYNTTGAIILTNDGDVAYKLTHPSRGVWKKYLVDIEGYISDEQISKLKKGVVLEEGKTAPARLKLIFRTKQKSKVELSIHEGKNRQIRRMFETLNRKILKLKRLEVGSIKLGDLREGEWRYLSDKEVSSIAEQ